MTKLRKLKGIKRLVHDAVDATVDLVQEGHDSTARNVRRVTDEVPVVAEVARGVDSIRDFSTRTILGQVKWVNRIVQRVSDFGVDQLEDSEAPSPPIKLRSDEAGTAVWWADNAVAVLNASVGDYLDREENQLDLGLRLRSPSMFLDETTRVEDAWEKPGKRVAVFVHGLGANEWSWFLGAEKYYDNPTVGFPTMLQHDLGLAPLFVRYNTGRSIAHNGAALRERLAWFAEWYGVEELYLLGHSMGGLVIRAAADEPSIWKDRVKCLTTIGTPHRGAPLAKLAHHTGRFFGAIDLPTTKILGSILGGRSAGVKDLNVGFQVIDQDDVPHLFLSATLIPQTNGVARAVGDLLVPVESAHESLKEGWGDRNSSGILHHQIQNHPDVYVQLLKHLEAL